MKENQLSPISLSLNFSGVILPVTDCEDGLQRVPLKPICETVGVDWNCQYQKVRVGYLPRRLGIRIASVYYADQHRDMVMIRVDRVAAFLNQINPKSVRSAGNQDSAEFLESKLCEWDDLLHAYEILREDMFPDDSMRKAIALVRIDRMRDPVLKRMALQQIGVSIEECAATNPNGDLFAA